MDRYGYDKVDQLIKAQYATLAGTPNRKAILARNVGYTYDAVGNRTAVTDTARLTPAAYTTNSLNQYTAVDGGAVGYDANGNLTTRTGWTYVYDAQNRLVQATSATVTVTFAYDPRNRCVARTVNGVAKYLVYDGWSVLEERQGNGVVARYIYGPRTDEPIAMVRADGTTVFYHQDGFGNVSGLTAADGSLVERYLYDVFGTATVLNGLGVIQAGSTVGNRFLYTGREWIAEAGLYDYRNRVYSAQLGRFLQSDPISFAGGDVNIYRYVGNGVLSWIDPWGLKPVTRSGILKTDDDGTGEKHFDINHKTVTAYTPNGKSMNADTDSYVVAPKDLKDEGVRPGDWAEIKTDNGKSEWAKVGDVGPTSKGVGEASLKTVHDLGYKTDDVERNGIGPVIVGKAPNVSVTFYPSEPPTEKKKKEGDYDKKKK